MVVAGQEKPRVGCFAIVRRGYDPGQVNDCVRQFEVEIEILVADRDAGLEQAADS